MPAGRKRKPIAGQESKRRVHRSNAEKKARRTREAALSKRPGKLSAPGYLSTQEQRDRFDGIVSLMRSIDGFPCTDLDADSIARYVLEEEEYLAAVRLLRKARRDKDAGTLDIDRCQRMKNSAFKCVDTAAKAIGLTIDSRLRFDIKKEEEKPENRFGALRNE